MDGLILFSAVSGSLVWHFPISVNYGLPYEEGELLRTTNGVQHKEELTLGSFLYAIQAYASDIFTESSSAEVADTKDPEPPVRSIDLAGKRILFFRMSQLASDTWPHVPPSVLQHGLKSWSDVMLALVFPAVSFLTQPIHEGLVSSLSLSMGLLLEYIQQYPHGPLGKRLKRKLVDHFLGTLPLHLLSALKQKLTNHFLPDSTTSGSKEGTPSEGNKSEDVREPELVACAKTGTDGEAEASDAPSTERVAASIIEGRTKAPGKFRGPSESKNEPLLIVMTESTIRRSVGSVLQSAHRPAETSSTAPSRPGKVVRAGRRFKNLFTLFKRKGHSASGDGSDPPHTSSDKISLRPRFELVHPQNNAPEYARAVLENVTPLQAAWSGTMEFLFSNFPVIQQLLSTKLQSNTPIGTNECLHHLLIFPDEGSSTLVEPVLLVQSTNWIIVSLDRSIMEMKLETISEDPWIRIPDGGTLNVDFLSADFDAIGEMNSNCFKLGRLF